MGSGSRDGRNTYYIKFPSLATGPPFRSGVQSRVFPPSSGTPSRERRVSDGSRKEVWKEAFADEDCSR